MTAEGVAGRSAAAAPVDGFVVAPHCPRVERRDAAAPFPPAAPRPTTRGGVVTGMRDENVPEPSYAIAELQSMRPSSLMVSVDYIDLVDRYDEAKAWEVLGKLKDLLG